jgi:tetratricopeptide (TPR) repeat protein
MLQRYVALAAAGQREAALRAASDACHADPADPRAHYAYGEAWLALARPEQAGQAFAAAIRLAPDWADAWVNLGVARYRQNEIAEAVAATQRALALEPGHTAARANLAAYQQLGGELDKARRMLEQALAQDPTDIPARLNLAASLLSEDQASAALAILDNAPVLPMDRDTHRHWLLQRAGALANLGRHDLLPPVLAAITALGPVPPAQRSLVLWRELELANMRGDEAAARAAAQEMATALAEADAAVPEHRIMGHFRLGAFWSGRAETAAAFAHWHAGHRLLAAFQPFSRERHLAFIDECIAHLSATRLQDGAHATNRDAAPVFIVGMPRSGTTLCEQILAAHPQAHGAGERSALPEMFGALAGTPAGAAGLSAEVLDRAAHHYLSELHALAPERARIVDKLPSNYAFLGFAARLLPGARMIHCVRDPRDIGLSIFTMRFYGDHPYAHDLSNLGWTIVQQHRLMAHWKAALPGTILTVALHEWVDDFDATLARVLAHVGLPHDPACARFHERREPVRTVSRHQVRQPINARGLDRWRRYATELAPLIAELDRGGLLAEWDAVAARRAEQVPPDMSSPHLPTPVDA